MAELNKDTIFVAHYGSSLCAVFDNISEAEAYAIEHRKKHPVLECKVSTIADFGLDARQEGIADCPNCGDD